MLAPLRNFASGVWWAVRSAVNPSPPKEPPPDKVESAPQKKPPQLRQVNFKSVDGRAGEVVTMSASCDEPFKGEKLVVSEDSDDGTSTQIVGLFVGNRLQLATLQFGVLGRFFALDARDNELEMDVCRPGEQIVLQVLFLVDCKFNAYIGGKLADLPEDKPDDVGKLKPGVWMEEAQA